MPDARVILRNTAAVAFVAAGANHFIAPDFYRRIVPPGWGDPKAMVAISGIAEIAGGLGLMVLPLRKAAGWGLIALLIAVFPANIYMAVSPKSFGSRFPAWLLWLRLPFQFLFIAWVAFAAGLGKPEARAASVDVSKRV